MKASDLLEASAGPFDTACVLVRKMEADLIKYRALYDTVNSMMGSLGAVGGITTLHPSVGSVMNAIHDIDGGTHLPPN